VGECFFWYWPTRVVPDQRPLNGCCVVVVVDMSVLIDRIQFFCNYVEFCALTYYMTIYLHLAYIFSSIVNHIVGSLVFCSTSCLVMTRGCGIYATAVV